MTNSVMLHVRMDSETKEEAKQALEKMGLSVSEAVRLFFHRVAREQGLPFAVDAPNAETRAAMKRARHIAQTRKFRFKTAEEMFRCLESEADEKE